MSPAPFSGAAATGGLPQGWRHEAINARKTATAYELQRDDGQTVLHARAEQAASLLMHPVPEGSLDLAATPVVRWRWKVGVLPTGANGHVADREDAAARLVFVFDGDRNRLPWHDRTVMRLAQALSGRELPYATLMYVTSSIDAVGQVLPGPLTDRVQMVVASRADVHPGQWTTLERPLVEDFRRAFGEAPGRLLSFGVLTDSDNTQSVAEAWYGDIVFVPGPP